MKSGAKEKNIDQSNNSRVKEEIFQESTMQLLYGFLKEMDAEQKAKTEDIFNTYFVLSLRFPFLDKTYQVGCYHTEKLARSIYHIVFEALENESDIKKGGGFDLRVDAYKGTVVKCPAGLRLEQAGCGITMIETEFTFQLLKKVIEQVNFIMKDAALLLKIQNDKEEISPEYIGMQLG